MLGAAGCIVHEAHVALPAGCGSTKSPGSWLSAPYNPYQPSGAGKLLEPDLAGCLALDLWLLHLQQLFCQVALQHHRHLDLVKGKRGLKLCEHVS